MTTVRWYQIALSLGAGKFDRIEAMLEAGEITPANVSHAIIMAKEHGDPLNADVVAKAEELIRRFREEAASERALERLSSRMVEIRAVAAKSGGHVIRSQFSVGLADGDRFLRCVELKDGKIERITFTRIKDVSAIEGGEAASTSEG